MDSEYVRITKGPKENRFRPAIDPLFRSAAVHFGPRTVGVILTGYLNDGTSGLAAIKGCGGIAVVQDPAEARYPDMPESARQNVNVDFCLRLNEISTLIEDLAQTPVPPPLHRGRPGEKLQMEAEIPLMKGLVPGVAEALGSKSLFTCPECKGILWEIDSERILRYRCHVGHAYTAESLAIDQDEAVERALWFALKSIEEKEALALRIASEAREKPGTASLNIFETRAREANAHAAVLRNVLSNGPGPGG